MKTQRFAIGLTLVNILILMSIWLHAGSATTPGAAPVLRGQALEIVDAQGRVRASIKVQPADQTARTADGKSYPDTVILRLIDPNGRPEVKLGASEHGAGLLLLGESDATSAVIKAEGAGSSLKLTMKSGQQKIIEP
jgi:hypothetical protein